MPRIAAIAGLAAAVLAGAAVAAQPRTHVMDVPLADGSVVHVQYSGAIAPKVSVEPTGLAGAWAPFPSFGGLDRMIAQMRRQSDEMIRGAQAMARQPGAPGLNIASYGNAPAGTSSVSVVTVSNGGGTCTRTTETVAQGAGKPPKVTSSVSGECARAAPQPAPGPVNRT